MASTSSPAVTTTRRGHSRAECVWPTCWHNTGGDTPGFGSTMDGIGSRRAQYPIAEDDVRCEIETELYGVWLRCEKASDHVTAVSGKRVREHRTTSGSTLVWWAE